MTNLLSEESRSDEVGHIREEVTRRLSQLQQRLKFWSTTVAGLGVGTFSLIFGGGILLILGLMPETIQLVSPASQSVEGGSSTTSPFDDTFHALTDFMTGVFARITAVAILVMSFIIGLARQSIMSFFLGLTAAMMIFQMPVIVENVIGTEPGKVSDSPFMAVRTDFESAVDEERYEKAWELLEPVPASEPDIAILKAQVAFLAGRESESLRLIQSSDIATEYPSETWRIESLHAETPAGSDYQLTESSQDYAETKASRRSLSAAMFRMAVPFGTLAIIAFGVAILLQRNARSIESWVKQ